MERNNKELNYEREIDNAIERYKDIAIKSAIAAFTEGYQLGQKHAERVFGRS